LVGSVLHRERSTRNRTMRFHMELVDFRPAASAVEDAFFAGCAEALRRSRHDTI
jgi:hypothetical protein